MGGLLAFTLITFLISVVAPSCRRQRSVCLSGGVPGMWGTRPVGNMRLITG